MNRCYLISKGWLTRKLIDDLIFKFSWDDGSLKFRAKISWFDVHKDLRETEEEKNSWNYYGMHTYMLCQLEHYGCFWILLSKKYLIQISRSKTFEKMAIFFQNSYMLVPKIEVCLKYFLGKKFSKAAIV